MAAPTHRIALQRLAAVTLLGAITAVVVIARWWHLADDAPPFPTGELRIGVDASYPPFAFDTGGELHGIDIEIGRALAEHLSMPVRFINMGIDGLYDSLTAEQVDVVISALQPEPWRTQEVRYTRPYFNAGLVLVSPVDAHISQMADIAGKSLAYEFGSSADAEVRRWVRRIPPFEMRPYELPIYALDAVRVNDADAAIVDSTSARLYRQAHPGWQFEIVQVTDVPYVAAVKRDRTTTFQVLDRAMGTLLSAGIIDEIITESLETG